MALLSGVDEHREMADRLVMEKKLDDPPHTLAILEQLATTEEAYVADMIEARRESAPEREVPDRTLEGWNNKPGWDNWAQKPKPFKKKTVYFRNR